jgi:hypothetical protein
LWIVNTKRLGFDEEKVKNFTKECNRRNFLVSSADWQNRREHGNEGTLREMTYRSRLAWRRDRHRVKGLAGYSLGELSVRRSIWALSGYSVMFRAIHFLIMSFVELRKHSAEEDCRCSSRLLFVRLESLI